MSSINFNKLKLNIFGESHGEYVGGTLEGLPKGHKISLELIKREVRKRMPQGRISTTRKETDNFKIISGLFNEKTTGMPLTVIIENKNINSKNYEEIKNIPRPSHSDYSAYKKYNGFNDYRGGGHFSGRLTVVLVVLGSICKSILENTKIDILTQVKSIGKAEGKNFLDIEITEEVYKNLQSSFPVCHVEDKKEFIKIIEEAKENKNSVGGSVQVMIKGLDAGIGDTMFNSIESDISKLMFGIGGIKGIEFGKGIEMSKGYGKDYNDFLHIENEKVRTVTNNSGGINGGITNGMEIVFTVFFRPTPSIGAKQKSVNLKTLENVDLEIEGRHDPCIAHRGSIVISNTIAIYALDLYLENNNI